METTSTANEAGCLSAICFSARRSFDWYADSGATKHMTDQLSILKNFIPATQENWKVTGIGGIQLVVHGQGDVDIVSSTNNKRQYGVIKEVLYVPNLGTNLFSIASATSGGAEVKFIRDQVTISRNGKVEMVGRRAGNELYYLDIVATSNKWPMEAALVSNQAIPISVWHQRLAHLNSQTIQKMSSLGAVTGLNFTEKDILKSSSCKGCILGKMHRLPFPVGRTKTTMIGELNHSDVSGPMQETTPGGSRFYVIFKDDFSRWRTVYFMKNKSEVAEFFVRFTALLENETGRKVRTLRSDNGGEYCSKSFSNWLSQRGIRHETSAPHSPQQNGVSERANRTIMEAARSLIHHKSIPLFLWGEAVDCAVHVQNRILSSTRSVTPYQAWYGKKPDVSYFRIFGSRAFAHVPDPNRRKLDPKAQECIFVGYSKESKAYRLWNPVTKRIVISRDVVFNEESSYTPPISTPFPLMVEQQNLSPQIEEPMDVEQQRPDPYAASDVPSFEQDVNSQEDLNHPAQFENQTVESLIPEPVEDPAEIPEVLEQTVSGPPRRSSRTPVYTERFKQYMGWLSSTTTNRLDSGDSRVTTESVEPRTYQEAISSEEAELWRTAIKEEYDSLIQNGTWTLTKLPAGRQTIKNRWVFKVKPAYQETAERYKARLVAKGYTQRYGVDYQDTYAPVVKHAALRVVLAIVAVLDLEMIQLDIKTAFLHGSLDEEIYMEQPEGFIKPGDEDKVCRLIKCIYGLKQASRVWNTKFNDFLLKFGLIRSTADPCVYYRHQEEEITFVIIYVDDGLVCSSKKETLDKILEHLNTTFEMRSTPVGRFIGIDIIRNRAERKLHISQSHFVDKLLIKFNMSQCNPRTVPADPNVRLDSLMSPKNEEESKLMEAVPYREAVGGLMYAMVMSRPDIAFAVSQVAKFCQNPGPGHWSAVKRILAYLAGTRNFGLSFDGFNPGDIVGFTDADYAGDVTTRRSVSGFIFLLNGGPVSWTSKQQSCVSLSTTESEFVAACESSKEAVWLLRLIEEIEKKKRGPMSLFCDNQSAIKLVRNPEFHQRTKHIDVKYNFIREQQERGRIDVKYIATEEQMADIFTKSLPGPRFVMLRDMIGVKNMFL